jgi:hypothetical protein
MSLDMVTAGPLSMGNVASGPFANDMFDPTMINNNAQRSIGMVQQITATANSSFFDINVQVNLPAVTGTVTATAFPTISGGAFNGLQLAQLTNSPTQPLIIVNTNVTTLPPEVVYIHGETLAVPLYFMANNLPYWTNGELFGYVTLAGHGVLPSFNCSSNGSTGNPGDTNCCVSLQGTGAVTTLLDATLGPVGSPKPGMVVPWVRTNGLFPTANTTLTSVSNLVVADGATNDLSATVSFNVDGTVILISRLNLGPFSNSIALPGANSTATFKGTNVPLSFQLSVNGTAFPESGTASLTMAISNTGSSSPTLYFGTNEAQPPTNFTVLMTAFSGTSTNPQVGRFYLQQNPTNSSLGDFTLGQAAGGGYTVATEVNANLQASTDNENWYNASGALQLVPGLPAATPTFIGATWNGTQVVLNWLGNFTLQTTSDLRLPWSNVSVGPISGPYPISKGVSQQFFRLAGP